MMPEPPLKAQNRLPLGAVFIANVVAYQTLVSRGQLLTEVAKGSTAQLREMIPIGAAVALTGLIVHQLSSDTKARIVFMRHANALPGNRAFSEYLTCDPRIDVDRLRVRIGAFPEAPKEQNTLWYRLYRSVASDPAVRDANRRFLFYRDWSVLALLITPIFVLSSLIYRAPITVVLGILLLGASQLTMAIRAARVSAERLVCTVLAITSAEREPAHD